MPKILIIEDEETIRRVLKKVLHQEDKNYEIIEARNVYNRKYLYFYMEYFKMSISRVKDLKLI